MEAHLYLPLSGCLSFLSSFSSLRSFRFKIVFVSFWTNKSYVLSREGVVCASAWRCGSSIGISWAERSAGVIDVARSGCCSVSPGFGDESCTS